MILLDLLSNLEILKWMPMARIKDVIDCFVKKVYEENDQIIKINELADEIFIISSGIVEIYDLPNNRTKKLRRGDYFGESCVME